MTHCRPTAALRRREPVISIVLQELDSDDMGSAAEVRIPAQQNYHQYSYHDQIAYRAWRCPHILEGAAEQRLSRRYLSAFRHCVRQAPTKMEIDYSL